MSFKVGDLVYNRITGQKGRIIRLGSDEDAYIVALPADEFRSEVEVLWGRPEIEKVKEK